MKKRTLENILLILLLCAIPCYAFLLRQMWLASRDLRPNTLSLFGFSVPVPFVAIGLFVVAYILAIIKDSLRANHYEKQIDYRPTKHGVRLARRYRRRYR